MNTFAYVRVSSRDQNEDRQLIAMQEFGVPKTHIYTDKQSGKDFNRPSYQRLMRRLKPGDLLVIKSIARLGRNYRDLTGVFISDLVLQILSYVAQTERENIRQRQREGIDAAKRKGVAFGRPRKPIPPDFPLLKRQWQGGAISSREAAKRLGV